MTADTVTVRRKGGKLRRSNGFDPMVFLWASTMMTACYRIGSSLRFAADNAGTIGSSPAGPRPRAFFGRNAQALPFVLRPLTVVVSGYDRSICGPQPPCGFAQILRPGVRVGAIFCYDWFAYSEQSLAANPASVLPWKSACSISFMSLGQIPVSKFHSKAPTTI